MNERRMTDGEIEGHEAALSVLGGVVLTMGDALNRARKHVKAEAFQRTAHRVVFDTMCKLADAEIPVDPVTLMSKLTDDGMLEAAGGFEFVLSLNNAAATAVNIEHHAKTVTDCHNARRLYAWHQGASARIREISEQQSPGEAVAQMWAEIAEQALTGMQGAKSTAHSVTMKQALRQAHDLVKARYEARLLKLENPDVQIPGLYEYPWKALNDMAGGAEAGELYLVGGRTGDGKTALMVQLAMWMAAQCTGDQSGGEYFSIEVEGRDIALRALASASRVDGLSMRRGYVRDGELDRMVQGTKQIVAKRTPMLHHVPGMSIEWVRDTARCRASVLRAKGLKIGPIWIDYLQDIVTERRFSDNKQRLRYISQVCKALGGELKTPVFGACQLLRGIKGQAPRPPTKSDIRGGDDLANPATGILLLYRPGMQGGTEPASFTKLIQAKGRVGPQGQMPLHFDGPTQRFTEPKPEWGGR